MMTVRMKDGELWERVKGGELNGYSFAAAVDKVARRVLVDIAKIVVGETEYSTDVEIVPPHVHGFYVELNSEGRVTMGFTDKQLEHVHMIGGTVVTEEEMGHTHRFGV